MCAITGLFKATQTTDEDKLSVLKMSQLLRHRGSNGNGYFQEKNTILAHERLSIIDLEKGAQPLYSKDSRYVLVINGEIYNHKELKAECTPYQFQTQSDSEVVLALYERYGAQFLEKLNGIFALVLYDRRTGHFLIARDHMGICPLYSATDEKGTFYIASELKALEKKGLEIKNFLPGHYLHSAEGMNLKRWYTPKWKSISQLPEQKSSLQDISFGLDNAVKRQLMSDVPFGVLLSGGLDSSLIAALAAKHERLRTGNKDRQIHSFAVGLKGSPDLIAAQKVANHIGSIHHEIHFTLEKALQAIPEVIYHIETYDVTTVRASTPMFLLAREIQKFGIKMVLSGEGSDELFGGYLYFHKAPSAQAFHEETVSKLEGLHLYDCLRANKSLMASSIEGRTPFLDKEFIDIAMQVDPKEKMISPSRGKIEKYVLRKAFEGLLPTEVLWRQKEQFSDGVGYAWIDTLKQVAQNEISDEMMEFAAERFPIQPPKSKEEYRYREIFESHFPSESAAKTVPSAATVACSTAAALDWDESFKNANDPSGRSVNVHLVRY